MASLVNVAEFGNKVPTVLWVHIANVLADNSGICLLNSRHVWRKPNVLKDFELRVPVELETALVLPYKIPIVKLVNCNVVKWPQTGRHVTHVLVECNELIENLEFPASMTSLKFGKIFKQPIEKLQLRESSLTYLEFGERFNRVIEKLELTV